MSRVLEATKVAEEGGVVNIINFDFTGVKERKKSIYFDFFGKKITLEFFCVRNNKEALFNFKRLDIEYVLFLNAFDENGEYIVSSIPCVNFIDILASLRHLSFYKNKFLTFSAVSAEGTSGVGLTVDNIGIETKLISFDLDEVEVV